MNFGNHQRPECGTSGEQSSKTCAQKVELIHDPDMVMKKMRPRPLAKRYASSIGPCTYALQARQP